MTQISSRERWLIGLGVGAALVVAVYVYVVEPALDRRRAAADLIPVREASLQRRRELVAQKPVLLAELEQATRQIEEESKRLLTGPTPPLAASELQRLVKDMAVATGVEVRSERVLAPTDREGLQEVALEITVAGGIRESTALLHQLDRTGKLLTLQDLKMRVASMGLAAGQARSILTTVTVAGYLPAAPPPAPAPPRPGTAAPKE
ncbi:MAG TPA: type II secretion system protein GspM [Candidatus Binatia bacterium]|nr:type II secretion system protein GspM [Candidatus Binatia bacterium]